MTHADEYGVLAAERYESEQFGCYSRETVQISESGKHLVLWDNSMDSQATAVAPLWLVRELLEGADRRERRAKLREACAALKPRRRSQDRLRS